MPDFANRDILFFLGGSVFGQLIMNLVSNLISHYLNPGADTLLSQFSLRWQTRTAQKKKKWEDYVQMLRSTSNKQFFAAISVSEHQTLQLTSSIWAGTALIVNIQLFLFDSANSTDFFRTGEYIFLLGAVVFLLKSFSHGWKVVKITTALRESLKPQTQNEAGVS